jgi:hypothetical protein
VPWFGLRTYSRRRYDIGVSVRGLLGAISAFLRRARMLGEHPATSERTGVVIALLAGAIFHALPPLLPNVAPAGFDMHARRR